MKRKTKQTIAYIYCTKYCLSEFILRYRLHLWTRNTESNLKQVVAVEALVAIQAFHLLKQTLALVLEGTETCFHWPYYKKYNGSCSLLQSEAVLTGNYSLG